MKFFDRNYTFIGLILMSVSDSIGCCNSSDFKRFRSLYWLNENLRLPCCEFGSSLDWRWKFGLFFEGIVDKLSFESDGGDNDARSDEGLEQIN